MSRMPKKPRRCWCCNAKETVRFRFVPNANGLGPECVERGGCWTRRRARIAARWDALKEMGLAK